MENLIEELKNVIKGEVLTDDKSLEHYSTDGSVFEMKPWAIVLPKDKNDIINLVKFISKKKITANEEIKSRLSITSRGKATDQAGGPINDGIILRFPGYLDKILEIGEDFVRVEPGVIWSDLFDKLASSNRYIPAYPASYKFATLGGGVANNCGGEKTVKYGSMRDWVESLKIVIASGEEIEVKKISQKEVLQKQSQDNFEGEIYRQMSDLIVSNFNLINNYQPKANKISTGYWLKDIIDDDNNFDLTKLITGSQGTLGIITEIKLKTILRAPKTALMVLAFDDLAKAGQASYELLKTKPSALEFVDKFVIDITRRAEPELLNVFSQEFLNSKLLVLVEFEGENQQAIKPMMEEAKKIAQPLAKALVETYDEKEENDLWAVRRSAAVLAEKPYHNKAALPFIEDSAVPPENLAKYLTSIYEIMNKYKLDFSVWGHAGNGNLHLQPFLNLADSADRDKLFKIADEVYKLAISLGGVISAEHNDGLMRSPFLREEFGPLYNLFVEVKKIFDPENIFNPHKKIDVDIDFSKRYLRHNYDIPDFGVKPNKS